MNNIIYPTRDLHQFMTFKKNIFFTKKKITPEKGGLQKKKKKSAVIIFVALNDIYPPTLPHYKTVGNVEVNSCQDYCF